METVRRRLIYGEPDRYPAYVARMDEQSAHFTLNTSGPRRCTGRRMGRLRRPAGHPASVLGRERRPYAGSVAGAWTNGYEEVLTSEIDVNGRVSLVTSIATVIRRGRSSETPCEPFHHC
jgi:hypothetical protein